MVEKKISVAIDGPAGAGKSTVAREVANRLGYIYIDTGAMYRAVALTIIREGVDLEHRKAIGMLTESLDIQLEQSEDEQRIYLNGEDVTKQIRSPEVASFVSKVASLAEVRELLVRKQQQMASSGGVVMDGRDIGTNVMPNAEVKIFMTASVEERARRRYEELKVRVPQMTLEQITQDIMARDEMDRTRTISPLVAADDAIMLDTTHLTIHEVVDRIVERCMSVLRRESYL